MLRHHERQALAGIGWFNWAERRTARERARLAANAEAAAWVTQAEAERARFQYKLDQEWARLLSNDPATVLETLAEAFADNEAPAAAVDVQGSELSLVVCGRSRN